MHGDSLFWKYGGILLWTDFWFKILLKFKASMPLFANFIFRNGRFFVSVLSHTLTALNSLFEEMSKIILWSRCSGDAASAKCNVKVDSYKSCSMFKGREYSLVWIWWRPNCKLTNGRRPSKETLCISGLLYFLEPWLRCLLLVLSNRFKTFTDWHPGLVRFPMLSMWSLQPYGAAVPSCLIQCSSRFRRKGVLKPGLFVGWYIFSRIRTFIERTEWSGRLKCLYNNWLPPVLIEDRCPFILFLNSPLVSPTYINPQRAHSIAYTTL